MLLASRQVCFILLTKDDTSSSVGTLAHQYRSNARQMMPPLSKVNVEEVVVILAS
jgi:hypothetical protein